MQTSHADTLLSYLRAAAARGSGITFIESRTDREHLSYGDLSARARLLLGRLQACGAQPRDEVVFQINGNRDFLVAFWACLLGGLVPVPLAVGNNEEHRRKAFLVWKTLNRPFLLADTAKTLSLLEGHAGEENEGMLFSAMKERGVLLDRKDEAKEGRKAEEGILFDAQPDDIALIQFSSGSTAQPKPVVVKAPAMKVNPAPAKKAPPARKRARR